MIDDNLDEEIEAGYFQRTAEGFELVIPFDSDHPEFTRGFMCGQAWQLLELGTPGFEMVITSDNLYMFMTMADAKGYDIEMEETGEKVSSLEDADWLRVSLSKKKEA